MAGLKREGLKKESMKKEGPKKVPRTICPKFVAVQGIGAVSYKQVGAVSYKQLLYGVTKFRPPSYKHVLVQGVTKFRLVSYNILAQAYTNVSHYSYSPLDCLDHSNRCNATLTLLTNLQSDFLCLQELDDYEFYRKKLEAHGYSSVYIKRCGDKVDGCGIFYDHNAAELLLEDTIRYNDLAKLFRRNSLRRDNVAIMAAFKLKYNQSNQVIIIANTHIFWDPWWSEVKFAQAKYLTKRLIEFKKLVFKRFGCKEPFVIVAGDFNSLPNSSVYRYLISGYPGYETWITNNEIWGEDTEVFEVNPMPLGSVYAYANGREPKFTNFKPTFKETLDYIFFSPSKSIKPICVLQLPESEESPDVVGGLPNFYHPSDHLPIGAEFEIRMK